jgi:hypothetical protein
MKAEPVCTDVRLWWTFKVEEKDFDARKTASFFHFDPDEYRAIRIFFYLTDVYLQSDPHVVVHGSHKRKNLSQITSLRNAFVADLLPC